MYLRIGEIFLPSVISAEYVGDYKIKVTFDDTTSGIADFKETIFTDHLDIIRELKDLKIFRDFKVDADTIVWGNGIVAL